MSQSITISSLTDGLPKLGSYRGILEEIDLVLSNHQSTIAEVGEVIEKDPAVTARLLKLANSAFYGFPNRMETVPDAISLIGIQQVQDLISATTIIEIFDGVSPDLVNMASFWKHSLACGVAARLLAINHRLPKPEKYFVTGLLHDVGRLVLYTRAPDQAQQVFSLYKNKSVLLRQAEFEVLGFDHTEIAESLLKSWSFPANLIHGVRHHHSPMGAGGFQREAAMVHVADYLINVMQLGSSGESYIPPLNLAAWDRLNLSPDMLESLMDAIDEQILAVEQAFMQHV
jgi:HD-like signal output (HDOD) protein